MRYIFAVMILLAVSLILFYPTFLGKPLGLDAMGHLSKISYLKQFPFASWDMSWYSGAPFLKFYSPLFYYLAALFPSIFGANFLCFLSIFLTSLGIFLLVRRYTKNLYASLASGLLFLTVLGVSYYFIAVGNIPYVFALFTLPFSLLFLEKSLENKKFYFVFSIFFLLGILSHIFLGICIGLIVFIRFLPYNLRNLKKFILYSIPGFLSSFWLFPFLSNSSQFAGDVNGYIPNPWHLLGLGNYIIWGKAPGEIGIAFVIFLAAVVFAWKFIKDRNYKFLLVSSLVFFALMSGILGKYYPNGLGALRFILPFAVIACIFSGVFLSKIKLRKIMIILFIVIALGLFWNFLIISENYNKYSYNDNNSRYYFMSQFSRTPIFNSGFDNYRFGTSRYVFGETMNYFLPEKSQTFGYHDQGLLYPEITYLMIDKIWKSDDYNSSLFFLDWFAIKKFEASAQDLEARKKFDNNILFEKLHSEKIADYSFSIYEYKEASSIISLARGKVISVPEISKRLIEELAVKNENSRKEVFIEAENISYNSDFKILNYSWERSNPDSIKIIFDRAENGSYVLFRELYHNSWKARDLQGRQLRIYKAGTKFMLVFPFEDSKGVIFYQSFTMLDYLGVIVSILSLIFVVFYSFTMRR